LDNLKPSWFFRSSRRSRLNLRTPTQEVDRTADRAADSCARDEALYEPLKYLPLFVGSAG
jgi:hypothetical protein